MTFRWKNYARGGTSQTTPPLAGVEFVRRTMLHVLPRGFVRIRAYGLLSNRSRPSDLARCRAWLAASPPAGSSAAMPVAAPAPPAAAVASSPSGIADPSTCATCRRGRLVLLQSWPRPTVWDLVARQSSPFGPRAARPAVNRPAARPAIDRRRVTERSIAAPIQDSS